MIAKIDGKHGFVQEGTWFTWVVELKFHAFSSCMGQRFIERVHEDKANKHQSFYSSRPLLKKVFSWLSLFADGLYMCGKRC